MNFNTELGDLFVALSPTALLLILIFQSRKKGLRPKLKLRFSFKA